MNQIAERAWDASIHASCRVGTIDGLLPVTQVSRERCQSRAGLSYPHFFFFFPSLFDSISNWEKQKVCDSLEKFKHSDAKQWKSLRQQPKPVSLKVRTQRLRVPSGKSEMADLNKTFPSIGKPQPGKGNEELQQMWHLYFWVPTCLFFELLFRALWDLYRSCKKVGASFSKCPAHVRANATIMILAVKRNRPTLPHSFIHSFLSTRISLSIQSTNPKVPVMYCVSPKPLQGPYGIWLKFSLFKSLFTVITSLESSGGAGALDPPTPSLALHHGNQGKSYLQETLELIFKSNPHFIDKETSAKRAQVTCPSWRKNQGFDLFTRQMT